MDSHGRLEVFPPPLIAINPTALWDPCHGWTEDTTTWVDAYLILDGLPTRQYLDIGCIGDECCITPEDRETAIALWEQGRVHAVQPYEGKENVYALITPHPSLNTDIIREALKRASGLEFLNPGKKE